MGSDVFTTKCEAHNYVVPYRSSCPVCVSAKRSQLHVANLAHMPRYLFEQQLDVRSDAMGVAPQPVRSFMKAPETKSVHITGAAVDVVTRYTVSPRSHNLVGYLDLPRSVQELVRALDTTTDGKCIRTRLQYQQMRIDEACDLARIARNYGIDMWYEATRVTRSTFLDSRREDDAFVEFVSKAFREGQSLLVAEPVPKAVQPSKYKLNFASASRGGEHLNETTRRLLYDLDQYEGGLGPLRISFEKRLAGVSPSQSQYQLIVKNMARSLWDNLSMGTATRNKDKVKDQFLNHVEWLYSSCGQRLTELTQ